MPMKYVKMYKDGTWENIQDDRVERFLEVGWSLTPASEKKSQRKGSKNKITAQAQVTSIETSFEDEIEEMSKDFDQELVEDIDFDSEETFAKKVATVKESYFNKKTSTESADFDTDESDDDIVETSGSMNQYLAALRKTQ